VTYTLGYYSAEPNPDNKFRELKVKVGRPGVNIRYRKGYFAMREPQQDEKTRKTEINNAVWSPLDSTAVGMNARVDLLDKPAPNTIHVFTQIDPANVTLAQNGDRWTGKLDILFVRKTRRARFRRPGRCGGSEPDQGELSEDFETGDYLQPRFRARAQGDHATDYRTGCGHWIHRLLERSV
jgi:hypothetical protein